MHQSTNDLTTAILALKARHPDWGYRRLAEELGTDRHKTRRAINNAERKQVLGAIANVGGDLPALIETARQALAAAKTVDAIKDVHDKAEALRVYGKIAKDHELEADAATIRLNAERRLGEMLIAEKEAGTFGGGRNRREVKGKDGQPLHRVTLDEVGIDRKLLSRAQKVAAVSEPVFEKAIARIRERIIDGSGVSLDIAGQTKKERRAQREKVLGGIQCALPTRKYGVILADPPWRFEPYSNVTGMDRAADNHYPTSDTDQIANLSIAQIAADDCVLFLWATVPMLPHALWVMKAWGFEYKSHIIWVKDAVGTGYWFRNQHELLLVGTRGNIPAPAPGTQWHSIYGANVGRHSAKPDDFLRMIEEYFPNLPKIELNRRGPARPGWDAWGNEAEAAE